MEKENEIFLTQDGSHSVFSAVYGVSYHSRYGAIQESRHVFVEAGLFPLLVRQEEVAILETGFGTGLNTYLTWLEGSRRKAHIRYVSLETSPLDLEMTRQLNYPDRLEVTAAEAAVFQQLHALSWGEDHLLSPGFTFRKELRSVESTAEQSEYDLIYFDAFAPGAQPELWEEEVLEKMFTALRPGGVLVTYCAKGIVKRRLRQIGFTVTALPGPPGKREMTKATRPAG